MNISFDYDYIFFLTFLKYSSNINLSEKACLGEYQVAKACESMLYVVGRLADFSQKQEIIVGKTGSATR